jgi:hypothetical protein
MTRHIGNIRIRSNKLPYLMAEQEAFRRDLAVMKKEDRLLLEQTIKDLDLEAQYYEEILINCFTRNGFAWMAGAEGPATNGKHVRKPKIQRVMFSHVFTQEERIYYKLEVNRHRFPVGTINMLPYKTRVIDLVSDDMQKELSFACNRLVTVKQDDFEKGVFFIVNRTVGADGIPLIVHYQDVLDILADAYDANYYAMPVVVGIGQHRKPELLTFKDHPHWLIAGTSGGGKSNMVNSMIATWLRFVHPDDLKLILIDLKQVEFKLYKNTPHLAKPVITDGEAAVNELDELMAEIHKRNALLARHDEKELSEWNRNHLDQKMPRIIVIIDELAELMLSSGSEVRSAARNLLERISNLGRAVGVNIVAATQLPTKEVVPSRVTGNMTAAIAVRTANWRQSMVILGSAGADKLPNVPGRVIFRHGSNFTQLQTPLIDLDSIKHSARIAKGHAAGVLTLEEQHPFLDADGMICWIADNLEGQLNTKAIADHGRAMGVPMPQLRALMEDLIRKTRVEAKGREFEVCPAGAGWRLEEITPAIEFHLDAKAALEHLIGETPVSQGENQVPEVVEPPDPPEPEPVPEPEPIPARKEINPLLLDDETNFNNFMELSCVVGPQHEILAKDFYAAYSSYCDEFSVHRVTKQMVGIYIRDRNFLIRQRKGQSLYVGISIKDSDDILESDDKKDTGD